MKKYWPAVLLGLGVGVTLAAALGHLHSRSCAADTGKWHFVEDRASGHDNSLLAATWSTDDSCADEPSSR